MSGLVGSFTFLIVYGAFAVALLYMLIAGLKNDTVDMDKETLWQDFSVTKEDMNF